jgi:type II secretory pathway component PulK
VPDFALRAEAVYRVQVGAAVFAGLYLLFVAIALAMNNRGFSEIGVNGLKAQDLTSKAQQDAIQGQEGSIAILTEVVDEIERSTAGSVGALEARLGRLEGAILAADGH